MVLTGGQIPARRSGEGAARAIIWHELECGSYRADRSLWLELAAGAAPAPGGAARVIDVGAGTGRVARVLARAGHEVTALDIDGDLLDALGTRPGAGSIQRHCADARSFTLPRRDFDACFVPMQTIQLLGPRAERMEFLHRARAHLRPGGLLACAIVTAVETFDCTAGEIGPVPETARYGDLLYVSRPTRVAVTDGRVVIERERSVVAQGAGEPRSLDSAAMAGTGGEPERDINVLFELDAAELEREGREAGLEPLGVREIAPTIDHVGSQVVVFRA